MEGLAHESIVVMAKALRHCCWRFRASSCHWQVGWQGHGINRRNPESAGKLFVPMLLGAAFAEAIAIYALVVVFTLK